PPRSWAVRCTRLGPFPPSSSRYSCRRSSKSKATCSAQSETVLRWTRFRLLSAYQARVHLLHSRRQRRRTFAGKFARVCSFTTPGRGRFLVRDPLDRAANPLVGSAAAKVSVHGFVDLCIGRRTL